MDGESVRRVEAWYNSAFTQKGETAICCNYRPTNYIFLLSHAYKVLAKIIQTKLHARE